MEPTLQTGDHILLNHQAYSWHLPFINKQWQRSTKPSRGDVIVFAFPKDSRVDFVKRIIGIPGDHIIMQNGELFINEEPVFSTPVTIIGKHKNDACLADIEIEPTDKIDPLMQIPFNPKHKNYHYFFELLPGAEQTHLIQRFYAKPESTPVDIMVPENYYFVLGDNRDKAHDSRFWGLVPKQNIKGKVQTT